MRCDDNEAIEITAIGDTQRTRIELRSAPTSAMGTPDVERCTVHVEGQNGPFPTITYKVILRGVTKENLARSVRQAVRVSQASADVWAGSAFIATVISQAYQDIDEVFQVLVRFQRLPLDEGETRDVEAARVAALNEPDPAPPEVTRKILVEGE